MRSTDAIVTGVGKSVAIDVRHQFEILKTFTIQSTLAFYDDAPKDMFHFSINFSEKFHSLVFFIFVTLLYALFVALSHLNR